MYSWDWFIIAMVTLMHHRLQIPSVMLCMSVLLPLSPQLLFWSLEVFLLLPQVWRFSSYFFCPGSMGFHQCLKGNSIFALLPPSLSHKLSKDHVLLSGRREEGPGPKNDGHFLKMSNNHFCQYLMESVEQEGTSSPSICRFKGHHSLLLAHI